MDLGNEERPNFILQYEFMDSEFLKHLFMQIENEYQYEKMQKQYQTYIEKENKKILEFKNSLHNERRLLARKRREEIQKIKESHRGMEKILYRHGIEIKRVKKRL